MSLKNFLKKEIKLAFNYNLLIINQKKMQKIKLNMMKKIIYQKIYYLKKKKEKKLKKL